MSPKNNIIYEANNPLLFLQGKTFKLKEKTDLIIFFGIILIKGRMRKGSCASGQEKRDLF